MIMSRLDSCDILVEHYLEVIDFQKEFKGREKSSLFPGVLSLSLLLTAHLYQSSITRIYERLVCTGSPPLAQFPIFDVASFAISCTYFFNQFLNRYEKISFT